MELLGNLVVILPDDLGQITKGGVMVFNLGKDTPLKGTVTDLGPGTLTANVDDKVAIKKNAGYPTKIKGEYHIIALETDILTYL